jgi:putative endopeptidase
MSHALDNWGSQYDADGNLNDWWSSKDKIKFKKIQNDIIKQYSEWAKRDNIVFDASIGIGENLADISGLAICEEYLRDFTTNNQDIPTIRKISFDAFYTYFAYQQRQKITKNAINAQLKTNPHPLDKYRTNVPLSRSEVFRLQYNIKPTDGMYWHNKNTVW